MPLALFLISVIVSGTMIIQVQGISQDSLVNQALVESTAAFYTAGSSAEVSWNVVKLADGASSVERLGTFTAQKASTQGVSGVQVVSGSDTVTGLEFNKGRSAASGKSLLKNETLAFAEELRAASAEVFFDAGSLATMKMDYCLTSAPSCPDLIVEWFEMPKGSGATYDQLSKYELKSRKLSDLIQPCENVTNTIKRCVTTTRPGRVKGNLTPQSSPLPGSPFRKAISLVGLTSNKSYLVRFRVIGKSTEQISYQFYGFDGVKNVALTNSYFEADEVGKAGASTRGIRQQQMVSGGLQSGLEFVHYTRELEIK